MKSVYIELDSSYGDLKDYETKWNSTTSSYDKIKKTYELQDILEEYDSLYSEKEDLESQVDELNEKIKELEEELENERK